MFAESLQDYAILQTAGIPPSDPMLAEINTYGDFPRSEKCIQDTLEQILTAKPVSSSLSGNKN